MTVSSGDIFLSATDVRNNARTFLIIHQEARAIEEAILFAADSGLLTAYIYNTYMTQTSLPTFEPLPTSNMVFSANPTNGQTITINSITWTFVTGTPTGNQTQIQSTLAQTLTQLATDLNASSLPQLTIATYSSDPTHLIITIDIVVDTVNNKLVLENHGFQNGDQIIFSSSGTFPTPLAGGITYFVLLVDSNSFQVCAAYLDVVNKNPVILSTAGTGVLQVREYSPQERYFDAWQGNGNADANRPLIDQMTGIMTYFQNQGYTITRQSNPNVTGGGVFWWIVRW